MHRCPIWFAAPWMAGSRAKPETSLAERCRRAIEAVGRFSSGKHDVAEQHDEYLANAFGQ